MRFDFVANILFPPVCVACRGRIVRGVICDACFSNVEIRDSLVCGECFAPLPEPNSNPPSLVGAPLAQSACHPDFPYVLGAAGHYEDKVLQSLIHHLKFRSIKGAAEPIAELMASYISHAAIDLSGYIAVPIPLSRQRFRVRGYNQSELIARRLAAALADKNSIHPPISNLPIETDILIRAKHAKPQSETTNAAERKENIRGAYAIQDSVAAHEAIRDANIILIDDVSTSGATFLEASRVLKAAGAKTILALAAAKT